jgi:hypothetical protein
MGRHEKPILQTWAIQPSERKLDKKKCPQNTSPRAQLSFKTITIVTNLDKQAFVSVAKFGEETPRNAKQLRNQHLPCRQRTNTSVITRNANDLRTIPAQQAATRSFRCQFTTVPTQKAQSVRLATGWTVRGSNPCDVGIFLARPDRPWAHPAFCTMGTASYSRGTKRSGHGVDNPTHLQTRLKKEYSYTSTIPPSFHGLSQGELSLYL